MANPVDMIDSGGDAFRVVQPEGVLRLLHGLFHLRSDRLKAGDRGATIIEVAQVLSDSSHDGRVVSRCNDGDRWSVTVSATGAARPDGTRTEVR
ncbi:hypothetical protein GCM10017567_19610 [Amycolatopsis bullii]|uniref:Uncharacterized protein n=2 Tax=Pseudonocardiaceae TaxID=2070 RepID=A0ABQ3K6A2_9PSEU|nr:hypothetical protein GCM10017567_19610 [Amycolatopsis bullii]